MNSEQIAEICHEANRTYCKLLEDNSQLPWKDAPEWQKISAINGVDFHLSGDRDPSDSHESWLKEKLEQGWKHGLVKDVNKKEHPCCLPYNELPLEQKLKDYIFSYIVKAFKDAKTHSENF